jgi:hypothetical protein
MYYQFQSDADWQTAVTLIESMLVRRIKDRLEPMPYTELVDEINPRKRDINARIRMVGAGSSGWPSGRDRGSEDRRVYQGVQRLRSHL